MNATQYVQFCSWLVRNCEQPIQQDTLTTVMTEQFWPATKVRNERWNNSLNCLESKLQLATTLDHQWLEFIKTAHEIILSESLIRVWFAVAVTQSRNEDVADIAECVIKDHKQIRKRVATMLDNVPLFARVPAEKTKQLQSLCDQATDLMLSQLPDSEVARTLAVSKRTFDVFIECARDYDAKVLQQANAALSKSYVEGISKLSRQIAVNEDLNQKIIEAILEVFETKKASEPVNSDPDAVTV